MRRETTALSMKTSQSTLSIVEPKRLELEAIAWRAPETPTDLEGLSELKGWFVHEFGAEVTEASLAADVPSKD